MKISEITSASVAAYLRLETGDYDATVLGAIMAAAREYIKSYTGLVDETVTGEALTESSVAVFETKYIPIVNGTLTVYLDSVEQTEDSDYTADYATGLISFASEPAVIPKVDYKAGIDAFQDFYIAYMVLCQDMHDNRSMYVDKSNVNKVVESILGMHCVNLL